VGNTHLFADSNDRDPIGLVAGQQAAGEFVRRGATDAQDNRRFLDGEQVGRLGSVVVVRRVITSSPTHASHISDV
jgi:hypothetical protein